MNNLNNYVDIDKINTQLEKADIKKRILIKKIYREYELYLNLLRDLLCISIEKGLNEIYSYPSINENFLNENQFFRFFEKKIRKLIYSDLPLLTVEQLKIYQIEKNINKEINFNNLVGSPKNKEDQKENFQYQECFQLEESIQFQISKDIFNNSGYYQAHNYGKFASLDLDTNNYEKFASLDLDNNNHDNYLSNNNIINLELFKTNPVKKIISNDSFQFLVGKKLIIKHPYPFIVNLEFNLNRSSSNGGNLPSIIFFNITSVELEYINLNLSIQRNKINELKNQFQRLIKKETYWRQKESTLNRIR